MYDDPHLRFIYLIQIGTYENVRLASAHMVGLQEGLLFMREHPTEAGAVLEQMTKDQEELRNGIKEMMLESVHKYARARM